MKKNILFLYKKLGESPLDTLTRYKHEHTLSDKLSFAGRLDPMAEGLLLVLRNEENKKRHAYEALHKTYECSFFCGAGTDTYDLLGKVTMIHNQSFSFPNLKKRISTIVSTFPGKRIQTYPPYSSYHIRGKPLFYWARENKLDSITLPTREIEIYSAEIISFETISKEILKKDILRRLHTVQGNFRQTEIKELWKKTFPQLDAKEFPLVHLKITCSSGTYIRGLVHEIGEKLKIPTVTISILRTGIGSFTLSDLTSFFPFLLSIALSVSYVSLQS